MRRQQEMRRQTNIKQNYEMLYSKSGKRKYCTIDEVDTFLKVSMNQEQSITLLCHVLALTGCRISEALKLRKKQISFNPPSITFETLKQRQRGVFREVHIPAWFAKIMLANFGTANPNDRLFPFSRTYAFNKLKVCFDKAGLYEEQAMPKALRHGYAVNSILCGVPINLLQRQMGHARIETTLLYCGLLGDEERLMLEKAWHYPGTFKPRFNKLKLCMAHQSFMKKIQPILRAFL